jgi:hypothetical protein
VRIVAVVLALASAPSLLLVAISPLSCESTTSPSDSSDSGGSTIPTEDGAVCACANPDCLPNCSDLPTCKLVCVNDSSGAKIDWLDPCGNTDYVQACANGCTDAAIPACE